MKKSLSLTILLLVCVTALAFAHHPTEDMLDEDLYLMIDDMVSDIHAEMVFKEDGGIVVGTLDDITVEDADDLIQDGLLEAAAALDGDVTITIEILETETVGTQPRVLSIEELSEGYGTKANQDQYQKVWDQPVRIKFLLVKPQ